MEILQIEKNQSFLNNELVGVEFPSKSYSKVVRRELGIGSYAWSLTTFWVITNALSPCSNYIQSSVKTEKDQRQGASRVLCNSYR